MLIDGGKELLEQNLERQLSNYWSHIQFDIIRDCIPKALERMDRILNTISKENKYVWNSGETVFSPMNSVQYSVFLYLLSNSIFKMRGGIGEADGVYYLNKIMNSCDWFYAIELPEIFFAEHPLGCVLGRAEYGKRLFVYQGCTVGGNRNGKGVLSYPIIGNNVLMYAGSSILGDSRIGDNVIISAGVKIIGKEILSNSIVFAGPDGNLLIKQMSEEEIKKRQSHIWKF